MHASSLTYLIFFFQNSFQSSHGVSQLFYPINTVCFFFFFINTCFFFLISLNQSLYFLISEITFFFHCNYYLGFRLS